MGSEREERRNHNIHDHHRILDAVPTDARAALDEVTGNGLLVAEIHKRVLQMTGIDINAIVLDAARGENAG